MYPIRAARAVVPDAAAVFHSGMGLPMNVSGRDLEPASRDGRRREFDLPRLAGVFWCQRWVMGAIVLLVVGVAAAVSWLMPPSYESEARIHLTEERPGFRVMTEMLPMGLGQMAGLASGNVQTDIGILKSRHIAEAVVDSLLLQVRLLRPRRAREDVLEVFAAPRAEQESVIRLRLEPDGSYSARVEGGAAAAAGVPARIGIGERQRIGELEFALHASLRADPPRAIEIGIAPYRSTVEEVQRNLHVYRPDPGAQLVSIRFRSGDPVFAAAVPNAATASFIRYKNRVNRSESHATIDFLEEQAATYERELRAAEARLQRYREQAQIVEPTTQASESVRQLAQLQATRDALYAERESLRRLMVRIERMPAEPAPGEASPYRQLAAFPAFLASGAVQNLLQELVQLETERNQLLTRRTEENLDVRGVNRRIAELETQLYQLARSYLDALETRIAALDGNLARFGAQLETLPAREVEFLRLAREQKLLDEVYTLIQTRLKEAQIQAAAEPANVQVVDPALVPRTRSSPRRTLNLAIGLVVGLVLGVGGALGREALDPRVRTAEEAAAAAALPVLAVVPLPARLGGGPGRNGRHAERGWEESALVVRTDPEHPAAEAFRTLRARLAAPGSGAAPRVVGLISADAAAERPLYAANLALAAARQGTPTLLVDADLQEGMLHRWFGQPRAPGLREVLLGSVDWRAAIREVETGPNRPPLHLLCAGNDAADAAELLASPRMRELLAELREAYALVIVEAPPLRRCASAAAVTAAADAALLSARVDEVARTVLQAGARELHALNVPLRGVVLADPVRRSRNGGTPSGQRFA